MNIFLFSRLSYRAAQNLWVCDVLHFPEDQHIPSHFNTKQTHALMHILCQYFLLKIGSHIKIDKR